MRDKINRRRVTRTQEAGRKRKKKVVMRYHRGPVIQQGAGLGSIFSGLIRTLVPVAKGAVKSIGLIVKSDGAKSVGRYLKKKATRAAIDTALEALEGRPVGKAAKNRLKTATKNILLSGRQAVAAKSNKRRKVKRKYVKSSAVKRGRLTRSRPLFEDY